VCVCVCVFLCVYMCLCVFIRFLFCFSFFYLLLIICGVFSIIISTFVFVDSLAVNFFHFFHNTFITKDHFPNMLVCTYMLLYIFFSSFKFVLFCYFIHRFNLIKESEISNLNLERKTR